MKTKKMTTESKTALIVYALFGVMMLGVVAVCLFLPGVAYAKKWEMVSNWLLMPGAAAACILLVPAMKKAADVLKMRRVFVYLLVGAFCLLAQIFAVRSYYFYTDWDVETIAECALSVIDGKDISRHSNYFSMYPNNLVLVTLFGWIAKLTVFLTGGHAYFGIIVFQCLISFATGVLLCCLIDHLVKSDMAAIFGGLLYGLLIGISPWVSIPYSDSVALFFPTAILAVLLMMPAGGALGLARMFLIAFLSYFGYRIKPQVLIVLIAIVLVWLAEKLFSSQRDKWRFPRIGKMLSVCTGFLCAVLLCESMAADVKVPLDENKQLGIAHFLMMGLNEEEFGAYYQRDVSYSWRIENREERTASNLRIAWERAREMGPVGLCRQFLRKTLTNYNDGTFCWGGEGIFYREILPETDGILSPFLRNLYYGPKEIYQGEYGKYYGVWQNGVQAVWMLTLLLSSFAVLRKKDERIAVVMLTLIGLTIFETLFEARARYLYCFVPLYIMMAAAGFEEILRRVKTVRC